MFITDTFTVFYVVRKTNESIKLNISKLNIAWRTDKYFKYKNPELDGEETEIYLIFK
jgi:hypothetical protein